MHGVGPRSFHLVLDPIVKSPVSNLFHAFSVSSAARGRLLELWCVRLVVLDERAQTFPRACVRSFTAQTLAVDGWRIVAITAVEESAAPLFG